MLEGIIIALAVFVALGVVVVFMSVMSVVLSAIFRLAGYDTKDDKLARSIKENEKLLAEMEEVLKESREHLEQHAAKRRRLPK